MTVKQSFSPVGGHQEDGIKKIESSIPGGERRTWSVRLAGDFFGFIPGSSFPSTTAFASECAILRRFFVPWDAGILFSGPVNPQ
ncbi:hypothetical protein AWENTII_001370 [Aspergillus wentii]